MNDTLSRIDVGEHIPFVRSASYPKRPGNAVRVIVDAVPALRRICAAIDAARHGVWATMAFVTPDLALPDGYGSLFEALDRAARRGLDVRLLVWRPNPETASAENTFGGSPEDHALLDTLGAGFSARWDRAHGPYCQHQKTWLMDAGRPGETVFVGGMNLTPRSVGSPGHADGGFHDMFLELHGPAAADVHHNFVQRWNEASERAMPLGVWGPRGDEELRFPSDLSPVAGRVPLQIQRTIHRGRYTDGRPGPGTERFDVAEGEQSVFDQYVLAIDAARRSIYIENQAIPIPAIADRLEAALKRGVEVVALVPAEPEAIVHKARRDPSLRLEFERLAALGRYETFLLAGIAAPDGQGGRTDVYVHSKAMLVDDAWATIGSANLHGFSLFGHSELNASVWDPDTVRALRCELLAEHLGLDTAALDDRSALALYRRMAGENRRRRDAGVMDWQGLVFALDPAAYGE